MLSAPEKCCQEPSTGVDLQTAGSRNFDLVTNRAASPALDDGSIASWVTLPLLLSSELSRFLWYVTAQKKNQKAD